MEVHDLVIIAVINFIWNIIVYLLVRWIYLTITSTVLISNISSFLEIHLPSRVWILLQNLIPKYPIVWVYSPCILYHPNFYFASKYNFKLDEGLFWGMHGMDLLENSAVTYHKRKSLEASFWSQAFYELSPHPY